MVELRLSDRRVHDVIEALKDFPLSTLKDVVIVFKVEFVNSIHVISETPHSAVAVKLEQTLLRFPRPNVTIFVDHPRLGRSFFWTQEIGKHYFPVLFQRGPFKVTSKRGAYLTISHFRCQKQTDFMSSHVWSRSRLLSIGSRDFTQWQVGGDWVL